MGCMPPEDTNLGPTVPPRCSGGRLCILATAIAGGSPVVVGDHRGHKEGRGLPSLHLHTEKGGLVETPFIDERVESRCQGGVRAVGVLGW